MERLSDADQRLLDEHSFSFFTPSKVFGAIHRAMLRDKDAVALELRVAQLEAEAAEEKVRYAELVSDHTGLLDKIEELYAHATANWVKENDED